MLKGYYFITDEKVSLAGNFSDVRKAISAGVKIIQYRNKKAESIQMYKEALKIKSLCKKARFLINDRIDIALAVDADGVHIGSDDVPYSVARKILGKKKIIGLTVNSFKMAVEAESMGVDYIGLAPIFSTKTKTNAGKPVGLEMIRKIRKHISIPIIAIGGIDISNAGKVVEAGADGICAISAVVTKKNVKKEIEKFQKIITKSKNRISLRN